MDRRRTQRRPAIVVIAEALRPQATLAMLTVLAAAPLLAIAALTPPLLVLPVFSVVFLILAGLVALFAWRTGARRHASTITSWDIAGALAFVGFAAAILSKPENVLYAFAGGIAG